MEYVKQDLFKIYCSWEEKSWPECGKCQRNIKSAKKRINTKWQSYANMSKKDKINNRCENLLEFGQ